MTELLLIRHGETAWNAARRLQGHLDVPLNRHGERQAAALGQRMLQERLDAVFASDLQRAVQTAQAIAAPQGLMVQLNQGLRERCYGAWEGMLYADIAQHYPQAYAAWQSRDLEVRFPNGERIAETMREFSQRVMHTILNILAVNQHQKIAIVTHGGVLECVYRTVQGVGFSWVRDFDILNASINRFGWNGRELRLLDWGDSSHLDCISSHALDETVK